MFQVGQVIRHRDGEAARRRPSRTETIFEQVPDSGRDLDRR